MKKIIIAFLTFIMAIPMFLFAGCGSAKQNESKKLQEFYTTVKQSQEYLDIVADDIYTYWYDAIYKDKYGGNVSLAVYYAQTDNEENIAAIEANEPKIQTLYKEVRDGDFSVQIKAVMSAYTDYYEFVVNVSGSFNSYKESIEKLKKELASSLKDLALEI